MYNQSLEQLIDAVIADGVITDQERKVVYKKAASLGIDQDEIEVYLEGRLVAKRSATPKSNKQGNVKLCPNCGANVGSFIAKCPECGHEFRNTETVESMEKFVNRLTSIQDGKQKCELISNYPIPNDKESLLEFLAVSAPQSKAALSPFARGSSRWIMTIFAIIIIICGFKMMSPYHPEDGIIFGIICSIIFTYFFALKGRKKPNLSEAWLIKTKAAMNKARLLSVGDAEFQNQIDIELKEFNASKKVRLLTFIICGIISIVAIVLSSKSISTKDYNDLINKGQYTEAEYVVEELNEGTHPWYRFSNYEEFMRLCIIHMCEDNDFEKAKKFIVNKELTLRKLGDSQLKEDTAIDNFYKIVWQYEHPGEEYISKLPVSTDSTTVNEE